MRLDVNGTFYDFSSFTTNPSPPLLTVGNGIPVDLSSAFNLDGITNDNNTSNGNLDGQGNSYSANQLGSPVSLNGLSFDIVAVGGNDVVQGLGQTVGDAIGAMRASTSWARPSTASRSTFTVTFTDGSTTQLTQALDDWTSDNGQTGEKVALSMRYRNPTPSSEVYLYGYNIPLDPAKTVASITMPGGGNVKVHRHRPCPRHRHAGEPVPGLQPRRHHGRQQYVDW